MLVIVMEAILQVGVAGISCGRHTVDGNFIITTCSVIATRRKNMSEQNTPSQFFALQRYCKGIEILNGQSEGMGTLRLRARTN